MDYQLVVKFWRKSLDDENFIATVQDELKEVLGQSAVLDGYDIGAKEINLFVITPDPKAFFPAFEIRLRESRGAAERFWRISLGRGRPIPFNLALACNEKVRASVIQHV